jgi:hypothetical protein
MNDALERVAERLRQLSAARQSSAPPAAGMVAGRLGRRTNAQIVGARVFDTVSGQEGEVVGRTSENVIVSTAAK